MNIPGIKTVVLDVGGVIFQDAIEPKMQDLSAKHSIPIALLRKEKRALRSGVDTGDITEAEFWRKLIESGGANPDREDLEIDRYVVAIPGAMEAIVKLSKLYPIALLTNDSEDLARARRAKLPIKITRAIVSAELGVKKPDLEIFRRALEILEYPPRACFIIDDVEENVTAAKYLGLAGLIFQSWRETLVHLGVTESDPAS